jgi:hypothetical protein
MNIQPILLGAALTASAALAAPTASAAPPTLETLAIPGETSFVTVARDILDVRFAIDPSVAAGSGLFEDAARAPSFDPAAVTALVARLDADMAALRAMPWRNWSIDRQVDWRWVYTLADDAHLQLAEEKLYLHRPASWLEPLANTYIALLTYAPQRADIRRRLTRAIPGMVAEMRRVAVSLTARDVKTADGVAAGILSTLKAETRGAERDAAIASLAAYVGDIKAKTDLPEFSVIGAEKYEERLRRALLLPWSPRQLLSLAQRELTETDAAIAELKPRVQPAPEPSPAELALAKDLNQEKLLGLYDDIARADREFLDKSDLLTVPPGVGPIHARPTPEAMIPLTGDGGSMNPPPPFVDSNVGWWNVEHFKDDWTIERRTQRVVNALESKRTFMGPYAAHEGVPGHHLQLSIARLNPNPLRNLLQDNPMVEGWAMYAEEIFWRAGGFGDSPEAESRKLGSWRGRIRRVFYDVCVECGDWTLQDAADFRGQARHGKGSVDEDVLRAINWPAQLIGYFSGKMQILELKAAYREKLGAAYTERKFNDALLAEGSIPVALIRAKLLGEPVPEP